MFVLPRNGFARLFYRIMNADDIIWLMLMGRCYDSAFVSKSSKGCCTMARKRLSLAKQYQKQHGTLPMT